jgi:hypothetical protein
VFRHYATGGEGRVEIESEWTAGNRERAASKLCPAVELSDSSQRKAWVGHPPCLPPIDKRDGWGSLFVVSIQRAKAVPALSLPRVVVGAGPQRPTGPVGADDDARGHSLRADEREFAWRGSIRKDTFASA